MYGKPLPINWKAGVMSHGTYYYWWDIRDEPIMFAISVTTLFLSMAFVVISTLRREVPFAAPGATGGEAADSQGGPD